MIFSTYFGGVRGKYSITNATAIALDSQGNMVIAGGTSATDLPITAGTLSQQCGCPVDTSVGFAAKLAAGGASLLWSTYLNAAAEMGLAKTDKNQARGGTIKTDGWPAPTVISACSRPARNPRRPIYSSSFCLIRAC